MVNGGQFMVNGGQFMVNGGQFMVNAGPFMVNAGPFMVNASQFMENAGQRGGGASRVFGIASVAETCRGAACCALQSLREPTGPTARTATPSPFVPA
jgi:hypothetical protein